MDNSKFTKSPRLYVSQELSQHSTIELINDQAHYIKNVMRLEQKDWIRLFNGRDGEWLYSIQDITKRAIKAAPSEQLKEQPNNKSRIHLLFAPIKKARMDFLIEKSVELGVTHLHPVITDHTEVRKINQDRVHKQIIEASEQCERLDIPELYPASPMMSALSNWQEDYKIFACLERSKALRLSNALSDSTHFACLVGPEGGFSDKERQALMEISHIQPIFLGNQIFRAETACLVCLSFFNQIAEFH